MTQQARITIHPDAYLGQFQQQLATHRSDLRGKLSGIEDGSLVEKGKSARPGAVVQIDFGPVAFSGDQAVTAACNRSFLDITRSLINYVDRIIAARRCVGTLLTVPTGVKSQEEIKAFFQNFLEEK
jgi:hypothetical protein